MPRQPSSLVIVPRTYAELCRGVEQALLIGQRNVERAKILTYLTTDKLINRHVLLNGARADYGGQVVNRLARDLDIARSTLYDCALFARYFPIVRHGGQLVWSHYRLLCQVGDEPQRKALTAQTLANVWSSPQLEQRIRALNAASASSTSDPSAEADEMKRAEKLLVPKRSMPGLYRVIARDDGLAVDIGFKLYLPLTAAQGRGLKNGSIVRLEQGRVIAVDDATPSDLFTYRATLRRVVDGDTMVIGLDLPHYVMDEKLRLRGLDCPELDAEAGKAAKRYVDGLMSQTAEMTVVTSKVDKYDRYLADVHFQMRSGEDVFLNNALLENGHAGRMSSSAQDNWTP